LNAKIEDVNTSAIAIASVKADKESAIMSHVISCEREHSKQEICRLLNYCRLKDTLRFGTLEIKSSHISIYEATEKREDKQKGSKSLVASVLSPLRSIDELLANSHKSYLVVSRNNPVASASTGQLDPSVMDLTGHSVQYLLYGKEVPLEEGGGYAAYALMLII